MTGPLDHLLELVTEYGVRRGQQGQAICGGSRDMVTRSRREAEAVFEQLRAELERVLAPARSSC